MLKDAWASKMQEIAVFLCLTHENQVGQLGVQTEQTPAWPVFVESTGSGNIF